MDFVERLKQERKRIETERAKACARFDREIAEIDAAIDAVLKNRVSRPPHEHDHITRSIGAPLRIDDAIVEAVSTGTNTPAKILDFLTNRLGIETTINSVRTRVSRLKNEGRLVRGERGWATPDETDEHPDCGNGPENGKSGSASEPVAKTSEDPDEDSVVDEAT